MRQNMRMTLRTLVALSFIVSSSAMPYEPQARPATQLRVSAIERAEPIADQEQLIEGRRPREMATSWPWLAIGGILAMLWVISYASRRHLPFGSKF
jgi:hypothetical protein